MRLEEDAFHSDGERRAYQRKAVVAEVAKLLATSGVIASPSGLVVTESGSGRPTIESLSSWSISLSYSENWVAAAFAKDLELGVDIEVPRAPTEKTLARSLKRQGISPSQLRDPVARADAFASIWTVQEACVKASGRGFAGRPWDIQVDPVARSGKWGELTWIRPIRLPDLRVAVCFGRRKRGVESAAVSGGRP